MTLTRLSAITVHVLAAVGVLFWIGMVVLTATGNYEANIFAVVVLAIVLGGAHVLISTSTTRGSISSIWLCGFVFVSDSLLGIFVDPKAFMLAGFTVVLLIAVVGSRRVNG
ncbi:MAG: hypothetical protein WBH16_05270 [Candidatus Nanopelagicales bacterium]